MRQFAIYLGIAIATVMISPGRVAGETRLGVKAGFSFATQTHDWYHLDEVIDRDRRSGLAFGLSTEFGSVRYFALRADIMYVQKGSQGDIQQACGPGVLIGAVTYEDQIDYLSVVLAARMSADISPFTVYILGGPRLDIKLGARSDIRWASQDLYLNSYKPTVTGLTAGTGIEMRVGPWGSLMVEVRYDYDIDFAAEYTTYTLDRYVFKSEETSLAVRNSSIFVVTGVVF